MKIRYFLLSAVVLTIFGCQSNDTQKPVLHSNCYLRFLQTEQEMKAQLILSESSDSGRVRQTELQEPPAFQGTPMKALHTGGRGAVYQAELKTTFFPEGEFTYKDWDKNEHAFKARISSVEDFEVKDPISKANGGTLSWTGASLIAGESFILLFTGEKGQTVSLELAGPSAGNELSIPAKELKDLPEGKAKLYLVRKKQSEINDKDQIVKIITEYYTATKELKITKL